MGKEFIMLSMIFNAERKPQQHIFINEIHEFENRLLPFKVFIFAKPNQN